MNLDTDMNSDWNKFDQAAKNFIKHTFVIPNRIGIYEYYFVFVPNVASGRKRRYTIYKIPPHEGRIRIVGRELDLAFAKKYVKTLLEKSQLKAKQTIAKLNRMRKTNE